MKNLKTTAFLCIIFIFIFSPSCKKSGYDINGSWTIQTTIHGSTVSNQVTFSGSKVSGTAVLDGVSGPYTIVNESSISFNFTVLQTIGDALYSFTGTILSKTEMSGSGTIRDLNSTITIPMTWSASKM